MFISHITHLDGIGKAKSCVIIGGGLSVRDLDFNRIPDEWHIIGINNHASKIADIIIIYDLDMKLYYDMHGKEDGQYLIGHRHGLVDNCPECATHYYDYYDCEHGDTGFRALQFADKVFKYKAIYLAGFDYCHDGKSYHWEDNISDPDKLDKFNIFSVGSILPKYKTLKTNASVYNLSAKSQLKCYPLSRALDKL